MIKTRIEDKRIFVESEYNVSFVKKVKRIGGKWNGKEWHVDENSKELLGEILLTSYGENPFNPLQNKKIKVEFKPMDFEGYDKTIDVGGFPVVTRRGRDYNVQLLNNASVIKGAFRTSGGSVKNPACNATEDIVMVVDLPELIYKELSEKDLNKLKVITTESKKEELEREKEQLLKRLAEIDLELASF